VQQAPVQVNAPASAGKQDFLPKKYFERNKRIDLRFFENTQSDSFSDPIAEIEKEKGHFWKPSITSDNENLFQEYDLSPSKNKQKIQDNSHEEAVKLTKTKKPKSTPKNLASGSGSKEKTQEKPITPAAFEIDDSISEQEDNDDDFSSHLDTTVKKKKTPLHRPKTAVNKKAAKNNNSKKQKKKPTLAVEDSSELDEQTSSSSEEYIETKKKQTMKNKKTVTNAESDFFHKQSQPNRPEKQKKGNTNAKDNSQLEMTAELYQLLVTNIQSYITLNSKLKCAIT